MPTFEERMALHNLRATLRREEIEREANERKARTEDRRKRVEESRVRTSALIDSLDAQFKVMGQFITRMVSEYKAQLVKACTYANDRINEFGEPNEYWRAVVTETTRQLSLSDVELMPLIHAGIFDPSEFINGSDGFGHHCLTYRCNC